MKVSVVWFKTDLRIHDNETLFRALEESDTIVPVYCWEDNVRETTVFGFKKMGNFRAQFLLEALHDLDQRLKQFGSSLLVLRGKPEIEIPKVVKQYQASHVYTKKEVAHDELLMLEAVEKELWKSQCILKTYSTSTLYYATDLPFSIKDIPDQFTAFRKKVEKDAVVRAIFPKPSKISSPKLPNHTLPDLKELGFLPVVKDPRSAFPFKGGESSGLARVKYYFTESKLVSEYKTTRNNLVGTDYSSKFSPWLALGCLSPREIYHELKQYEALHESNESTYWLIFELLWRDYFRFMMKKHHSSYFLKYGLKPDVPRSAEHNEDLLMKWVNGETDEDFVNANMLELKHTGFMSNRGRQIVASYLCNDLKLDWRYGAAYFEEQLIDYDVCSNWGNWAYLAGVGNDPRKDRYFNISKQAELYDKAAVYRKLWLSEKLV